MALTTPEGDFKRYAVTATQSGRAHVDLIEDSILSEDGVFPSNAINAWWQETSTGHVIELAIPNWLVGEKLGLAFYNVNDPFNREIETIIATSNPKNAETLGTLLTPSPALESVLNTINDDGSRVWVVDRHARVFAKSSYRQTANGVWEATVE